jgi:hypothetical protein
MVLNLGKRAISSNKKNWAPRPKNVFCAKSHAAFELLKSLFAPKG